MRPPGCAGGIMPGAEEGADGFEKFPACSRCSSSWFSWLAVPPVNCSPLPRWCPAILPCEAWREARWCLGGIAELFSDIEDGGIPEGAIAAGCVEGVARGPDNAELPGFGP